MAFHRRTLSRVVALLLALALPLQGVSAQVAGCAMDGGGRAAGDHAAMSQMQHDGSSASGAVTHNLNQQSTTSDAPCMRTVVCVNGPAMIAQTVASDQNIRAALPLPLAGFSLEARELRPDSPPPKS